MLVRLFAPAIAFAASQIALLLLGSPLGAQPDPDRITPTFSWRSRAEQWSYFTAPDADEDYGYIGSTVRFGILRRGPDFGFTLEGAAPILLGLPDDAVSATSRGALGLGATYWSENRRERNVAQLFVKQAFARIGVSPTQNGHAVRIGRFEFSEGLETSSADATMAALKRTRIAERLIGPFSWTHVGRSFDGLHYRYDRRGTARRGPFNVTLAAFAPTEGAFNAHAWRPLDLTVGYGALAFGSVQKGGGATDARLFALYYDDRRTDPIPTKIDNRAAALRVGDRGDVQITSIGAHLVQVTPTDAGSIDLLAWGVLQGGDWGALDHQAGAAALELGWQPRNAPGRPWIRAMWFRSSGDRDALDGDHETFFEVLSSPRSFARFPINNQMNLDQVGGSITLRPSPRVTVRADVQSLRLSERTDLWYAGGGAFRRETFGFSGRQGAGARDLSVLTDLSVDFRVNRGVTLSGYAGRASAGEVIRGVHPGTGAAFFGYVELDVRY